MMTKVFMRMVSLMILSVLLLCGSSAPSWAGSTLNLLQLEVVRDCVQCGYGGINLGQTKLVYASLGSSFSCRVNLSRACLGNASLAQGKRSHGTFPPNLGDTNGTMLTPDAPPKAEFNLGRLMISIFKPYFQKATVL